MTYQHIGVVGGGAWGTALAIAAARAGRQVTLWEHDAANAEQLTSKRESLFLPGVRIDDAIAVTRDGAAVARAPALLLVVPAQAMRKVVTALAPAIAAGTPLVVCAKGIEAGTHAFMSDIVSACAPKAVPAILSGPSFAADVARGLPTAVTLAAPEEATAAALAQALGSATFRPYHSTDVRGAEIGGAAKNVLAIGAGIVAGRQLGASATAALITRGFAELTRFGRAFGARAETLTGLSGLGDLVLTCSTPQSRNFSFGHALGKGQTPDQVRAGAKLSEGAFTAPVLVEMARAKGVEMPISAAVAAILDGTMSVGDAIEGLLTRPFRAEG
jgi:glycerol-3-phosphate dehydrogenase (NAD(P)+)